jgi:PadR family transcriptional regulator, regulatory protein PadR
MGDGQWPAEWLRGVLELCVLAVVAEGPTYGYAISQALQDAGLGAVKGGTLYPLMARCEQAGFVEIEWRPGESGPGRKYYALSDAGRAHLNSKRTDWLTFTQTTHSLLTQSGKEV